MTAKTFGCVGVTDDSGSLVGIVTDGDLRRRMGPDLLRERVGDVMTRGPLTIRANALAAARWTFLPKSSSGFLGTVFESIGTRVKERLRFGEQRLGFSE